MTRVMIFWTVLAAAVAANPCTAGEPLSSPNHGRLETAVSDRPSAIGRWITPQGIVRVKTPAMSVGAVPVVFNLRSEARGAGKATFRYQLTAAEIDLPAEYEVELSLAAAPDGQVLVCKSLLRCDRPLHENVRVVQGFDVLARPASALVTEQCRLNVGEFHKEIYTEGMIARRVPAAAYFEMGKESVDRQGTGISMPVVAAALRPGPAGPPGKGCLLSLAADPYCGAQFYAKLFGPGPAADTQLTVVTNYHGCQVPVRRETRTLAMQFQHDDADAVIRSFYHTIPEIKPGAAWIHGVAMNYYDYFGDGTAWYRNLEKLAQVVPAEHRGKVVCCIHGWYDRIGYYCFDMDTGKLADEWKVFGKFPNSKAEMHRRMAFAKQRGFRVILYFADGLNSPDVPEFYKGMVFKDEQGKTRQGWVGPDMGGGPQLDPASPLLRRRYRAYMRALLAEFGRDIDGFVWDETGYMGVGDIATGGSEPTYADRATMSLFSELAQIVQDWHKVNPDLVLMEGSHYYYGLVAHGSYTDFGGLPLVVNYRNTSWQCCWEDPGIRNVHTHCRTDPKVDYPYGLDIGLTDAWGSWRGPAKMPPKTLAEVMVRFLQRVQAGPPQPKIKTIADPDRLLN